MYVGTGTDHIDVSSCNPASGGLSEVRPAAQIGRPGFLAIHPGGSILYAVGREFEAGSAPNGFAAAYSIDRRSAALRELNRAPTSGRGASHVAVSSTGHALIAVNYGDGNIVSLTLEGDGRLGSLASDVPDTGSSIHPERQQKPHPHSANLTPDGGFGVVPNPGADGLVIYAIDPETARLAKHNGAEVPMVPGSGPRHMTFHANGAWAYVINELASPVALLDYDAARGSLQVRQTFSTLPEGYDGPSNTTAEVLVHPNGCFLYGSNRGSNTIALFAIDSASGQLYPVQHLSTGGDWPCNFRLTPNGRFLLVANQRSDDVHVLSLDPQTGQLTPTGAKIEVPSPMCVRFVPMA